VKSPYYFISFPILILFVPFNFNNFIGEGQQHSSHPSYLEWTSSLAYFPLRRLLLKRLVRRRSWLCESQLFLPTGHRDDQSSPYTKSRRDKAITCQQ